MSISNACSTNALSLIPKYACARHSLGGESQRVKPKNICCKMCTGDKDWGEEEEGRRTREEMRGNKKKEEREGERKEGEGRRKKGRRGKEEEGGTLCKKGRPSVLTYFSFLSKSLAAKTGAFRNVFSPAGFMGEHWGVERRWEGGGGLAEGKGERREGEIVASEEESICTQTCS